jgi:predicted CoA-binding protein
MKPTLVIGANNRPEKYAYKAVKSLLNHGHSVCAFGRMKSQIDGIEIETEWNPNWKVDTVTLYLNPQNQVEYYHKIIDLKPKRVIFNPGTENETFQDLLESNGISTEIACTLVLLSINEY